VFSDSAGSTSDCKCLASEIKRSKSSSSQKGATKRFESWLVQEYCDEGAMCQYLGRWPAPCEDQGDAGSLLRVLHLLRDAAQGLQELHNHKVVHGDLVSISRHSPCCFVVFAPSYAVPTASTNEDA
jgi:serine/threonine protein kinase